MINYRDRLTRFGFRYLERNFRNYMGQVEYKGNVYKSIGDRLDLSNLGVRDLNQIYALQDLKDIKELDPSNNRIAEIEGFASLRQLEVLNLKLNQRIR